MHSPTIGAPSIASSSPIMTPADPDVANQRTLLAKSREPLAEPVGKRVRPLQQAVRLDRLDRRQRRGTGDRVPAERRGVGAGDELLGKRLPREQAAARDAAGEGLRQRERIGNDAEFLERVPRTRPAHAGLHLVEDQHQALLVRERSQSLEEPVGRQIDAAFALDRLDQNRRRLGVDELLDRLEIAERSVSEAREHRFETVMSTSAVRSRSGPRMSGHGSCRASR